MDRDLVWEAIRNIHERLDALSIWAQQQTEIITEQETRQNIPNDTFEKAVSSVIEEMYEVMLAKQQDYGPGNISKFGELGVLVRASDKVERLSHLLQSGREPNHESLEDSWLDLANYGLIGLIVHRGLWGAPMADGGGERKQK